MMTMMMMKTFFINMACIVPLLFVVMLRRQLRKPEEAPCRWCLIASHILNTHAYKS